MHVNVGTARTENSISEKLFGLNIDSKLNFDKQIKMIYGKAQSKINALKRVTPFMIIDKR